MRRRNDYDRSYRYEGRRGEQGRGESERGFSQGQSRHREDDRNERYFGGSRRHGEGYSDADYERGRGAFGRGLSSYRSDQQDDRFFGENYPDRDDYDRYYEESPHRGLGSAGYRGGYTSGMYGGGIGGYSGGGYQGYDPSSYRTSDYRSSRGYYGTDYPESESGYYSGRSGRQNDRGWWDRTSDEVASWFGDEDAERRREMDRRAYDHRGRGPKNYTRSDDRIKEDVSDRLEDSSYLDASDIDLEVSSGEVVLTGTVESRYAKRLAEDLAERCSGVKNVENRLRVDSDWYHNRYGSPTTSGATSSYASSDTKTRSAAGQ